jgi:hypothetical protein
MWRIAIVIAFLPAPITLAPAMVTPAAPMM